LLASQAAIGLGGKDQLVRHEVQCHGSFHLTAGNKRIVIETSEE